MEAVSWKRDDYPTGPGALVAAAVDVGLAASEQGGSHPILSANPVRKICSASAKSAGADRIRHIELPRRRKCGKCCNSARNLA